MIRGCVETRPLARIGGLVLLLASVGGCQSGARTESELAQCAEPLQGARYQLCGRLSTNGFNTGTGPRVVTGTMNSSTAGSSSRYQLIGGTFHASH